MPHFHCIVPLYSTLFRFPVRLVPPQLRRDYQLIAIATLPGSFHLQQCQQFVDVRHYVRSVHRDFAGCHFLKIWVEGIKTIVVAIDGSFAFFKWPIRAGCPISR